MTGKTVCLSSSSKPVSANAQSYNAIVSNDGMLAVFASFNNSLVAADTNPGEDVFVADLRYLRNANVAPKPLMLVDRNSGGQQANGDCLPAGISDTSPRRVLMSCGATNMVPNDQSGLPNAYVRALGVGTTEASVTSGGVPADGNSYADAVSPDGRYVLFELNAGNLPNPEPDSLFGAYLRDTVLGTTTHVAPTMTPGVYATIDAGVSVSADGRLVAFSTLSANVVPGPGNAFPQVYVHDRVAGTTVRISTGADGLPGYGRSVTPAISADGKHVAFVSTASNFADGNPGFHYQVWVSDFGSTRIMPKLHWLPPELVSLSAGGSQRANADCGSPAISGDGRYVAFNSGADNLVPKDTNKARDVFVRQRW